MYLYECFWKEVGARYDEEKGIHSSQSPEQQVSVSKLMPASSHQISLGGMTKLPMSVQFCDVSKSECDSSQ